LYKCHACGKQFLDKNRLNPQAIWDDYQQGKQTYQQLAQRYNCSVRTIQRKIDQYSIKNEEKLGKKVIILMDTTYWGRGFGVMVFRDAISKENLLKYYLASETNTLYHQGIKQLQMQNFEVQGIVCDGRKGLLSSFGEIPVQMCQFHQQAILRRYLTQRPKMQAAIELKAIGDLLKNTNNAEFITTLSNWYNKWKIFLNEKSINLETKKKFFTHKRLRSAYNSLKNNTKWLFTYEHYPQLKIPKTTNAIDGHFADLKTKLRNHNGLSRERKKKFIDGFLKA